MNIHLKRILIIFSAALNIGFLVTALFLIYNHPKDPPHHSHMKQINAALEQLDLPSEQEKDMREVIENFQVRQEQTISRFKQARTASLKVLAKPGPIDRIKFDEQSLEIKNIIDRRHVSIRNHLLEIRKLLGDENGARFFSTILRQVKAEKISK